MVADITGDGLADVANRDSGAYRVLLGNNGSAAQSYTNYPTVFFAGSDGTNTMSDCNLNAHQLVATGDFNHDGRPDLVYQSNGSLLVYLTDANGQPNPIGDLAQDGSLTTSGQLTAPDLAPNFGGMSAALGYPAAIGSVLVADLDGDGNQDLLVLYANLAEDPAHPGPQSSSVRNWLYVWYGTGDGKFLTSAAHPVNPVRIQPSRDYYEMAVGRLDNSGKPLLAMSDGYLLSLGTLGAEQHLLAGQGINAVNVADVRGTGRQDLVIANGGLTLANPVANHEMLAPNLEVNSGGITVLLNQATITASALTAALAANPEPSLAGSSYTLTLTLTPAAGGITPIGAVRFSVDNTSLGPLTVLVPNGTGAATATVTDNSGRLPGTYQLAAAYSGDPNYAASVTQTVHNVVLPAPASPLASVTTLSSSLNPSAPGQAVVVSASVTLPGAPGVIASGPVLFTIDGAAAGPATALDASGVARINLPHNACAGHPHYHGQLLRRGGGGFYTGNWAQCFRAIQSSHYVSAEHRQGRLHHGYLPDGDLCRHREDRRADGQDYRPGWLQPGGSAKLRQTCPLRSSACSCRDWCRPVAGWCRCRFPPQRRTTAVTPAIHTPARPAWPRRVR